MKSQKSQSRKIPDSHARWVPCEPCEDYLCLAHGKHASQCSCPPISEMDFDPYAEGNDVELP